MSEDAMLPCVGTWVIRRTGEDRVRRPGQVKSIAQNHERVSLTINWLVDKRTEVVPLDHVECGLQVGFEVHHSPQFEHEAGLGSGRVMSARMIGGRQQLLVDFLQSGARVWMPWQRLRFIKGAAFRFRHGDFGGEDSAERFRLRSLAYALQFWNENTGSLARFDIDPLPHQIQLVHHILGSGNFNWLIADDVGLGKTIEAGLLIAALRQRGIAKRVLVITPAGLTRQWQEDLKLKMGLNDFLIYGSDFIVADNAHWRLYDRVIASLDKAKQVSHLDAILSAEPWDLIIFDEAHRLTRRQWGQKFERSDRFRLAEALRARTRNMVMLTATPHQGRQDQFIALLELLRPELKDAFQNLELDASVLSRMVFRNRKADVTDMEGAFIFHGQTSRMIEVDTNAQIRGVETKLQSYLKRGYQAAESSPGQQGKAIGFVMTVYRKLAASSIVALRGALIRRLARIRAEEAAQVVADQELDERYLGEYEESMAGGGNEFFAGELDQLLELIADCAEAAASDDKMQAFKDRIIGPILAKSPDDRVLIFTEYRGTQDYIATELRERFGEGTVSLINGSMSVEERRQAIRDFESTGRFLVSTEAGGEGLNLHRKCHLMVNYDLPWNPMRLVQRIGRLYRYGQKLHVLAFNLRGIASVDEQVVAKMYERLEQVAKDMAGVSPAEVGDLVPEVMGSLASLLDVEDVLSEAAVAGVARTEERIDEALRRARESAEQQHLLFQNAATFDAEEMKAAFQVGTAHLRAFVFGLIELQGGAVSETRAQAGKVWRIQMSEITQDRTRSPSRELLVTFDRALAHEGSGVQLLDMDQPFVKGLVAIATDYEFQGHTARVDLASSELVAGMLRWQDEFGTRLRQEFVAFSRAEGGRLLRNPASVSHWLLSPALEVPPFQFDGDRVERAKEIDEAMDRLLASQANLILQPESREWLAAAIGHAGPSG